MAKARDRPTAERNTFAEAHIAGLQGRTWVKPTAAAAAAAQRRQAAQPTQQRRTTEASGFSELAEFPPLPGRAPRADMEGRPAWTGSQQPVTSQQLEQLIAGIVTDMQRHSMEHMAVMHKQAMDQIGQLRQVVHDLAQTVAQLVMAGPHLQLQHKAMPMGGPYRLREAVPPLNLPLPEGSSTTVAAPAFPATPTPPQTAVSTTAFVSTTPAPQPSSPVPSLSNVMTGNTFHGTMIGMSLPYNTGTLMQLAPSPAAQPELTSAPAGGHGHPPSYSGHPPASTSTTNDQ